MIEVVSTYLVEKNQMGDERPLWFTVLKDDDERQARSKMIEEIGKTEGYGVDCDFRVVRVIVLRETLPNW